MEEQGDLIAQSDMETDSSPQPSLAEANPSPVALNEQDEKPSFIEKKKQSAKNALNFLEEKRDQGFFEDKEDLSSLANLVFEHITERADGAARVLDSDGLRYLTSVLSKMEEPAVSTILDELVDGLVIKTKSAGNLSFGQWQERLNDSTIDSGEREDLESAQFGYLPTVEDAIEDDGEGADSSKETFPETIFLQETIKTLEEKISEKNANGESFAAEQKLLIAARVALEAKGKLSLLAREVILRDLEKAGYVSPEEVKQELSGRSEQSKLELIRLCEEKGFSEDKIQEIWSDISSGDFSDFVATIKNVGSIEDIFGKTLTEEDYERIFGSSVSQKELRELIEKNGNLGWDLFFALLYLVAVGAPEILTKKI